MIGIIDYGAGNLLSVKKALDYLKMGNTLVRSPSDFTETLDRIILPGVGAFGAAVDTLKAQALYEPVAQWLAADKPFLGICLGMQLLFEESLESPGIRGFGIFQGDVPQFTQGKVPQIGWNQVKQRTRTPLFEGIADEAFFYFLHGYYVDAKEPETVIGETDYGISYTSAVQRGRIYGVQF
ncbi:imidazole glycerol phosphate synthase subunit HisH, partial [candidate division KSB3 bacterium]|nr:imidazole glycerol phosphate synthase subunit HisH [candidate division KSB3 bacterium]MBD3324144.1 imidazole glycerol phosphate synthase subunit HisH [candidate division KSB3 bacterium]